jgi:8-oxo-dGTP diphosphatase
MSDAPVTRVVSSPYVRCMETVAPLAEKVGVAVEPHKALAEGHTVNAAIELLVSLPDHAVACSHGDVIPAVVDALVRQGMQVEGEPDWRKGAVWVLERDGDEFVRAVALPPPA